MLKYMLYMLYTTDSRCRNLELTFNLSRRVHYNKTINLNCKKIYKYIFTATVHCHQ